MLLPDNICPELTIYYNSFIVLQILNSQYEYSFVDLYQKVREVNDMSFPTYILCLDWLYLIESVKVNEKGKVVKCL